MKRSRGLLLRVGLLATVASSTIAAVAASPALAGTHGQQVTVVVGWPIQYVNVCGYNQNWKWTCFPGPFPTGAEPLALPPDNGLQGYWWQGKINIWGWRNYDPRHPARTRVLAQCNVPSAQRNSDWYTCRTQVNPGSVRVL